MRKALFLDRDGIINVDAGYVHRVADFNWQDGIFDLVVAAREAGFSPVVTTNQSGIGRGYYTESAFHELTRWMCAEFERRGGSIERVYHCPYHPEALRAEYRADHAFRKPKPGMILAARDDLDIDLAGSISIGDQWTDVEAANAAGVGMALLVGEPKSAPPVSPMPVLRLPSVRAAATWFVSKYAGADL
jgi:D-glycero-D-manno-heptose 1,7-bisphosphate phosphatase